MESCRRWWSSGEARLEGFGRSCGGRHSAESLIWLTREELGVSWGSSRLARCEGAADGGWKVIVEVLLVGWFRTGSQEGLWVWLSIRASMAGDLGRGSTQKKPGAGCCSGFPSVVQFRSDWWRFCFSRSDGGLPWSLGAPAKELVRGLQKARRGGDSVVVLWVYGRTGNLGFEEDGAGDFLWFVWLRSNELAGD